MSTTNTAQRYYAIASRSLEDRTFEKLKDSVLAKIDWAANSGLHEIEFPLEPNAGHNVTILQRVLDFLHAEGFCVMSVGEGPYMITWKLP